MFGLVFQVPHRFSGVWFTHSFYRSDHQGDIGVSGSEAERFDCYSVELFLHLHVSHVPPETFSEPFTFLTVFVSLTLTHRVWIKNHIIFFSGEHKRDCMATEDVWHIAHESYL